MIYLVNILIKQNLPYKRKISNKSYIYITDGRAMEKNTVKKSGVLAIVLLIIGLLAFELILYYLVDAPLVLCAVIFVIFAVISAVLIYVAKERFDEINEGQDDDCNNY